MAKLIGPALSLDASKSLKKTVTFQKTPSGNKIYLWKKPGSRAPFLVSPAQLTQRAWYQSMVVAWNALSDAQKSVYNATAKAIHYLGSGFNYYIHQNVIAVAPPAPKEYVPHYPPSQNDTYVKATSSFSGAWAPYHATDPTESKIGPWGGVTWIAGNQTVNQRFHIDLGAAYKIERIYIEASHESGGPNGTLEQWKNFTFQGSNEASAFADLDYTHNTNWNNLVTDPTVTRVHILADTVDPQYFLVTNTVAYRYYAIKMVDNWGNPSYMASRHIELQTYE